LIQVGAVAEAVALLRGGWSRHSGDFWINFALAFALSKLEKPAWGEVVRFYTAALALRPNSAAVYYNLGNALRAQQDLKGAIAAYQKAIKLNPKNAKAYNNLGLALQAHQDLKGAIAAYQKAIKLNPKDAKAYNNLGGALEDQQDLKGAITAFRQAIKLNPKYALAHGNLGLALQQQGKFAQALRAFKEAAHWWPAADRRRCELQQVLRACQRQADIEGQLPAILSGRQQPQSDAEGIEYARVCQAKQRYAAAARLYEQAFTADSKLAADLRTGQRYNAACAAAQAGCGRGKDMPRPDEKEQARWREQAVAWLGADLALWGKLLEQGTPQVRAAVGKQMQHWQQDPDLAGIRQAAALARLPAQEQAACKKFWADVAAMHKRAAAKP
jgi:tetratricopeptide (TPR) repeat protein